MYKEIEGFEVEYEMEQGERGTVIDGQQVSPDINAGVIIIGVWLPDDTSETDLIDYIKPSIIEEWQQSIFDELELEEKADRAEYMADMS